MAEAIVGGALLRIAQHAIRLGGLLEALFGGLIVRVAVRMMLQSHLPIRRLDLLIVGFPSYTKDFVIIALGHWILRVATHGRTATFTMAGRNSLPLKL